MQLHPTRNAIALTATGIAVVGLGLFANQAALVGWGGALLVGLQLARAVTLLGVTQIRTAGFEMLWREEHRVARIARNEVLTLHAEVRNRDERAVRYVHLRALASPHLKVVLDPDFGEVPAGGRLEVTVRVEATRVGRHGIFGLSLEVQGSPGLYEVPLTFSNPFGVEVLPHVYHRMVHTAVGGRSRFHSEAGAHRRRSRGASDFRELRDYQAGDAFKHVAWKASAKRGKLVVREFEQNEREVVWLLVDVSVELWAGQSGKSPLDVTLDRVGLLARQHIEQGDRVGLALIGARRLVWLTPRGGAAQLGAILEALSFATATYDADRCTLDEGECAMRVAEHLRTISVDADTAMPLSGLVDSATTAMARAPFQVPPPMGHTNRDQIFRHYMARFGMDAPPRLEPDRPKTDFQLLKALADVLHHGSRPSRIWVCSPVPRAEQRPALMNGLKTYRGKRHQLSWLEIPLDSGLVDATDPVSSAVVTTLHLRSRAESMLGRKELIQLGIRCESPFPHVPAAHGHAAQVQPALT
jgi:uncharacterized protein (DUF58 family)